MAHFVEIKPLYSYLGKGQHGEQRKMFASGAPIYINPDHVVSVQPDPKKEIAYINMINGQQYAIWTNTLEAFLMKAALGV